MLGVVRREGDRFWLSPVDKRERRELAIHELKEAGPGDLVLCEVSGRPPRVSARVDAVLGDPFAPRSFSLIAIHKHGLRAEFAQEAIDVVVQARLARTLVVPSDISPLGVDIPIDGTKILFFGHSQGGLNGPLFLATDDAARGAVLSGSAGIIAIALVEKEEPFDVSALIELILDVELEDEGWDTFHPVATTIETDDDGLLNRHSIPNHRMLNEAIR